MLLVQNTNPAVVAPDSLAVRRGLLRDDLFVCVHEQFMTDTARLADLVLPATTFLEHDDLYQASGHTFLQAARALIAPLGECRANHDFISQLAARLGVSHPAFEQDAWALVDQVLRESGQPDADSLYAAGWHDCTPGFARAHFLEGFGHADGRFRFAPDWAARGEGHASMPRYPDHQAVIDAASAERPFRLVAAPARHFLNSSFTETPSSRQLEGRPTAQLHPDAAARLGIADGELIRLGNAQASVLLHARTVAGVQPDTVVVESQWPNDAFIEGVGINALVSAEPGFPAAGVAYHDTAVWVQRVAGE